MSTAYILLNDSEQVRQVSRGDIVQSLQYHHFVGQCIIQDNRHDTDKTISKQPLDSTRDNQ